MTLQNSCRTASEPFGMKRSFDLFREETLHGSGNDFVSIIALEAGPEPFLLRDISESLGKQVLMFLPGQPNEVVAAMERARHFGNLLILSGHGKDGGFYLGDFGDEIDVSVLRNGILTASAIGSLSIGPVDVISSCCETGQPEMVSAFRKAGAKTFLAPPNWPEGRLVPLFLHIFLTEVFVKNSGKRSAVDLANSVSDLREDGFKLFDFS